jgi:hypothetical protein
MIPPISTRLLQAAIERQRRDDAALRWRRSFGLGRTAPEQPRRDIPIARPLGPRPSNG